jgi:histidine triad (HIT) family protein
MSDQCLFCKIRDGEIPGEFLYRDEDLFAIRDINPQAPYHILLIPNRHIAKISDLRGEDAELSGKLIVAAARIAESLGFAESGYRTVFNCGSEAGQTVYHIHLHVLGGRALSWPPG